MRSILLLLGALLFAACIYTAWPIFFLLFDGLKPNTVSDSANLEDIKFQGDKYYFLISIDTTEGSSRLHQSTSKFISEKLYLSVVDAVDLREKQATLTLKKIGDMHEESSYPILDLTEERIKIIAIDKNCSIYTGPCKIVKSEKKQEALMHERSQLTSDKISIDNEMYKVGISLMNHQLFFYSEKEKERARLQMAEASAKGNPSLSVNVDTAFRMKFEISKEDVGVPMIIWHSTDMYQDEVEEPVKDHTN